MKKFIGAIERANNDLEAFLDIIEEEDIDILNSTRDFVKNVLSIDFYEVAASIELSEIKDDSKKFFIIKTIQKDKLLERVTCFGFLVDKTENGYKLKGDVFTNSYKYDLNKEKYISSAISNLNPEKDSFAENTLFNYMGSDDRLKVLNSKEDIEAIINFFKGNYDLFKSITEEETKKVSLVLINSNVKSVNGDTYIRTYMRGSIDGKEIFGFILYYKPNEYYEISVKHASIERFI